MQITNSSHFDLMIACCKRKYFFNAHDVVRLEASSNYTLIHTVNSRPLVVAKVLSAYEEILEGLGFIRVHRSHLINSRFLKTIDSEGRAVMTDDLQIKISRRRRKSVIAKLVDE